ncbi:MAG: divalent-cation tolerance protein CutA [Patescibacteria group bacterium]|nr:divalent-cation tolerance protein CutA [Patescibacteria group bacterium]
MNPTFLYLTSPSQKVAKAIAFELLNKRLVACVNLWPITSLYQWQGKTIKEKEVAVLIKTFEDKVSLVEEEIKKVHPYEIPILAKIKANLNPEYLNWMKKNIK